jgi:flagellin-like protein
MSNKKAQSEVITTVLLILIAIIAVMIISGFVINFISDRFKSADCLEVQNQITIKSNLQYTCHNLSSNYTLVQVEVGDIQNITKGFQINLDVAGSAISARVPNDTAIISLLNGGSATVPVGIWGGETYKIKNNKGIPDTIRVIPILPDGRACTQVTTVLESVKKCI